MIFQELKRYLKMKLSIIGFVLCFVPVLISVLGTYMEYSEFKSELALNSSDVNMDVTRKIVYGTDGLTYIMSYFSSSDMFMIFIIISLFVFGAGIFLTGYKNRNNGFGNMIYTRVDTFKGNVSMIASQFMYIFLFVFAYYFIIVTTLIILFPITSHTNLTIPMDNPTIFLCLSLLIIQMFMVILFFWICAIITNALSFFINNIFVIAIIPLLVEFLPLVLCSVLSDFNRQAGHYVSGLIPDVYLLAVFDKYSMDNVTLLTPVIFIVFYSVVAGVLAVLCYKKIKKEYI